MRLIGEIEKEIVLEENDKIFISMMKGNKVKIQVSCQNGALFIDDISIEKINALKEEENAIKSMKEYNRNQNKKD